VKVDVFFTIPQVKDDLLHSGSVVLIDVLRATTTICHAMENGAQRVIPVGDLGEATSFVESLGRANLVLGGERDALPIEGFDLGNSPLEYTEESVGGSNVVLLTSNGCSALTRMRHVHAVAIASFANHRTVVDWLLKEGRDVVICCAGSRDQFCIEDSVCAGLLVSRLQKALGGKLELNDAARVGEVLVERYADCLVDSLKQSSHGRHLLKHGFAEDLETCARLDVMEILPFFVKDQITLETPAPSTEPQAAVDRVEA
jgi:2-phosphosulfolactate phosphatase